MIATSSLPTDLGNDEGEPPSSTPGTGSPEHSPSGQAAPAAHAPHPGIVDPTDTPGPRGTPVALTVDIADDDGLLDDAALAAFERLAHAGVAEAVRGAGAGERGHVNVTLADDRAMAAHHARLMGDATTTDVISVDLTDGRALQLGVDADLVVCVDEARRQCEQRGHALEAELTLYVVHGVLHGLGHDDIDPDDAQRMHAEEDRVLRAIGLGAVYARKLRSGGGAS